MGNQHPIIRAVRVTEHLCALPSIATQDWATDAARALTPIAPGAVVSTLVAQIDRDAQQLSVISTGIALDPIQPGYDEMAPKGLYLKDKLERLTRLGAEIPSQAWSRGLIASFKKLSPQWNTQPMGRVLAAQNLARPILVIVPIASSQPGLCLIICISFDAAAPETPETEIITTLVGVLPTLTRQSQIALSRVNNPKAWLTERELEILDQLIEGHSVRVIADKLGRSAHTVHDHVKNLHKKIGASSRGELIAKAMGHTSRSQAAPELDPVVLGADAQVTEVKPTPDAPPQRMHARPLHAARQNNT